MRIVIDDNCLNRQGGNGGASYDDSAILARLQKLENRTDNFVKDVTVSREGNKVKFTYTRVDGTSSEVEFDDKDTITASYDDTELRQRVTQLEAKEDSDKQTLSLQDRTLSISNGNSVTLPASGGSIASAISAYSGSYKDIAGDLFLKGSEFHSTDGSNSVPALSDGELQLVEFDDYTGLRVKDPSNGVVTMRVNHRKTIPEFNSDSKLPKNSSIYIEINSNSVGEPSTNMLQGFFDTQDSAFDSNDSTHVVGTQIKIIADITFVSAYDRPYVYITFFKDSHVYTTTCKYTYVDEHTMTGEFDFPAYADFGLEERFKKLKLNLNC